MVLHVVIALCTHIGWVAFLFFFLHLRRSGAFRAPPPSSLCRRPFPFLSFVLLHFVVVPPFPLLLFLPPSLPPSSLLSSLTVLGLYFFFFSRVLLWLRSNSPSHSGASLLLPSIDEARAGGRVRRTRFCLPCAPIPRVTLFFGPNFCKSSVLSRAHTTAKPCRERELRQEQCAWPRRSSESARGDDDGGKQLGFCRVGGRSSDAVGGGGRCLHCHCRRPPQPLLRTFAFVRRSAPFMIPFPPPVLGGGGEGGIISTSFSLQTNPVESERLILPCVSKHGGFFGRLCEVVLFDLLC